MSWFFHDGRITYNPELERLSSAAKKYLEKRLPS
jgi:hypothetical protein